MKKAITILTVLITLTSCAQESNTNQKLQTLLWSGKAAVGTYAPEGTLAIKNIQSQVRENSIQSLVITVDMKSLYQENSQLTKHLRDKDFFHVKKYPEAIFELTEPFIIGTSTYLTGRMSIKDKKQTEKIAVVATLENKKIILRFDHTMNRLDYGITYNSPSVFEKLKENAIADKIVLRGTIRIEI